MLGTDWSYWKVAAGGGAELVETRCRRPALRLVQEANRPASRRRRLDGWLVRTSTTGLPDALDALWSYYESMAIISRAVSTVLPSAAKSSRRQMQARSTASLGWLALSTNPTRSGALDEYKHATAGVRGSWRNAWPNSTASRGVFLRDDAYNAGTHALLINGANHFLSMVDAFTTVRSARERGYADWPNVDRCESAVDRACFSAAG